MKEIANEVYLDDLKLRLVENKSHNNIFIAYGERGEHDVKGLYSLFGYYDTVFRYSVPITIYKNSTHLKTIVNFEKPQITVKKFMEHLKENQNNYKNFETE